MRWRGLCRAFASGVRLQDTISLPLCDVPPKSLCRSLALPTDSVASPNFPCGAQRQAAIDGHHRPEDRADRLTPANRASSAPRFWLSASLDPDTSTPGAICASSYQRGPAIWTAREAQGGLVLPHVRDRAPRCARVPIRVCAWPKISRLPTLQANRHLRASTRAA
jgi:hypothetical protein